MRVPMAEDPIKFVAKNKKAFHEFEILERYEAGIALVGTEVKSLREGKIDFSDSYARIKNGEVFLLNLDIPRYHSGGYVNHESKRPRKLLLHRHQITKLYIQQQQKKLTMVPLALYFKDGMLKVELGLARGKKLFDKRQDLRKKFAERDMKRATGRPE